LCTVVTGYQPPKGVSQVWRGIMYQQSYNCYKTITKDLNLGKPWEEKGKEEPDSLIAERRKVNKRLRESLRKKTG
jgi:hypothetical protein